MIAVEAHMLPLDDAVEALINRATRLRLRGTDAGFVAVHAPSHLDAVIVAVRPGVDMSTVSEALRRAEDELVGEELVVGPQAPADGIVLLGEMDGTRTCGFVYNMGGDSRPCRMLMTELRDAVEAL